jgi:multidrug efflux pump subunit AcrB
VIHPNNTRVQLHDLLNTVILGFIFVVFILMFFMGFTNAFFVGLSVPLATLVAFPLYAGPEHDHEYDGAVLVVAGTWVLW